MSLFLAPFLLGAALATPAIEAIGDDINAVVGSRGEFQVNGSPVAIASDVTAAVEAVRSGLSDRLDRVERQIGSDGPVMAAISNVSTTTDSIAAALDTFSASQAESLAGLEASLGGVIGWIGGKNATATCTTDACSIVVYGRGFVAIPNDIPNDLYTVTATIEGSSTTMPCAVTQVQPTFVRCTISGFQSPPAQQFWLSLAVTEADQPFPFLGGTSAPAQMVPMVALGPTISLGGVLFLSYGSDNGAQMSHVQPIIVADPDHPDSQLTVTFSSDNTEVLPNGGMSYDSATGDITFVFQRTGTANVRITVTDTLGLSASVAVDVALVMMTYSCDSPAVYRPGYFSCDQDPVDPHWGRGSSDCAPLIDGDMYAWSPANGRHIEDVVNGHASLSFDATTVMSVNVVQVPNGIHGYFELWAHDLNGESETYGQLVRFFQAPPDGGDVQRITNAVLPASLRRTDMIQFKAAVPQTIDDGWNDFTSTYRLTEIQLVGCA